MRLDAKVSWKEGLSFAGAAESGFVIPLDARPEVGGENEGIRPMEMIALGLVSCTAMDVI
jgi:putative redox protein